MTDEQGSDKDGGGEGGSEHSLGILSALKEAIEETIQEAKDRGDLDPEKAKEFFRGAMEKAQAAAGEARGKLEEMRAKDFPSVQAAVDELKDRVQRLEDAFKRKGEGNVEGGSDPNEDVGGTSSEGPTRGSDTS